MTRLVRTPDAPALKPGQIVAYRPGYLVGVAVNAEVLGAVENPPFADVPLYRLRLLGDLPGIVLPGFNGKPDSAYPALARGEEAPGALHHELTPL